ncbi:MAG: zinc ribbon domain-containing protein [Anaerolineaceae bacterium]|nr:zinc ribbon domain-containing protein [Anaerolineaceae bacterium]
MPSYEFRCRDCRRRFELFLSYNDYGAKPVRCPHCQSDNIQRKIGRVRVARSSESRMESMADPSALAGIDEDPRALGKMMREMSSEVGEEMGPEFDEVVGRLEAGQSPDEIEKQLPDLGAGGEMGGGDFGGGGFGGGGMDDLM